MTEYFSAAVAGNDAAEAQLGVDRVRDALVAGTNMIPSTITWVVQGDVQEIDEATGVAVNAYGVTSRSGAGSLAPGLGPTAVGGVVTWLTSEFVAGKRVKGRTFIVPVRSDSFTTSGDLNSQFTGAAALFGAAMGNAGASDCVHVIWSRPFTPKPGQSGTARAGSKHGVTGFTVPTKVSVLRSRRD